MRARGYDFTSRWRVAAGPPQCWSAAERMLRPGAATWWPGVSVAGAPSRMAPGERIALVVRSPFGYRLRVHLTVVSLAPGRRLVVRSDGDLAGVGTVELAPAGAAATEIIVRWCVSTRRPWMNATAAVLRPVFVAAHAVVMRAGERGLRRAVARASEPRNAGSSALASGAAVPRG
ncbi:MULTISPECIES: hypothetical protein [Microbacterium]|uniref:DUF1990 domain-containing protein n=1 Tax=Microbacterium wangchenii TaxID=2541726 RepID=A0ABX5SV02_9MICO|nr:MULTISPECIES: hypothetical protein [Microbacterium]MCK6065191.1 hypothetical protein [Microbacterium sp. EYE_512]QBR88644.1 hypothetical protein E4K62_08050 [Microbacterium wangchenii]TXK20369.1 hypothetical protein FVP99_01665 [Microbacterium wangchenii]